MTTERKKASNRKNARKSTGPRSLSGKAVVSRNARKHGLLSRHLIVEGESQEEFSELLNLLMEEFQPVGMVEHALVERVGIALWRQRRLVRAETADVNINRQRFGPQQTQEVCDLLQLERDAYKNFQLPDGSFEKMDIGQLREQRSLWQSFIDENPSDELTFANMPHKMKAMVRQECTGDANLLDAAVKEEFRSWNKLFEKYVEYYDKMILVQRFAEMSELILQSQALPYKTDLLARYQTALDNDLYKALKVLRETQAWRQARTLIHVVPEQSGGHRGVDEIKGTNPSALIKRTRIPSE